MNWKKKGLVLSPQNLPSWAGSHLALPFAEKRGDRYRIYFSPRNSENAAFIMSADLDCKTFALTGMSSKPLLGPGNLGAFDDCGTTNSWLIHHNEKQFLYYSGWTLTQKIPFLFFIGLAVSQDQGKTFRRVHPSPILERNEIDPYLTASPCILIENGTWRMWYVSGTSWSLENGRPKHYYHIKYAESKDGIAWKRTGIVCIDYSSPREYAIARPCVIKSNDIYRMWYSYRGDHYRIGYAESKDGLQWERKDHEAGLNISDSGWDSEMTEYAHILEEDGQYIMFYNGNEYGKTGIGVALCERNKS